MHSISGTHAYRPFSAIHQHFINSNISLVLQSNYMSVSKKQIVSIQHLLENLQPFQFACLIVDDLNTNQFHFTFCPYKHPKLFRQAIIDKDDAIPVLKILPPPPPMPLVQKTCFSVEEFDKAFAHTRIHPTQSPPPKDGYASFNSIRKMVKLPLTLCLSKAVISFLNPTQQEPAIEIGSGVGYSFAPTLSKAVIRTQQNTEEAQLLSSTSEEPVFQIDLAHLCKLAEFSGKSLSKVFDFNAFSSMYERNAQIQLLSSNQRPGDKVMAIIDQDPSVQVTVAELLQQHPNHEIFLSLMPERNFPEIFFLPIPREVIETLRTAQGRVELISQNLKIGLQKKQEMQTILEQYDEQYPDLLHFFAPSGQEVFFCPKRFFNVGDSTARCIDIFDTCQRCIAAKQPYPVEFLLTMLRSTYNLEKIPSGAFFAKNIINDFSNAGYHVKPSYKAVYAPLEKEHFKNHFPKLNGDLIIRFCGSIQSLIEARLGGIILNDILTQTNLEIPDQYNLENIEKLKSNQQILCMVVIMTIEATKI